MYETLVRVKILNVEPAITRRHFCFFTKVVKPPYVTIRIEDDDYQALKKKDPVNCVPQTIRFPWRRQEPPPKAGTFGTMRSSSFHVSA